MTDIDTRIQDAKKQITGNEALLEMLETEAATEMLDWGMATATSLVNETNGLDDIDADLVLAPRLKALRQSMRSVGNWAAGKYVDPASRVQLRDKLLEHLRVIFGEGAPLPSADQMDELLNQSDDERNTAFQLISNLRSMLEQYSHGGDHA